jgi:hypothetical protein
MGYTCKTKDYRSTNDQIFKLAKNILIDMFIDIIWIDND